MSNSKTGRNEPCICGSGLKFKKCCGASTSSHYNASAAETKPESSPPRSLVVGTNNMLMNRVEREARKVAEYFDQICARQIDEIDSLYSAAAALLYAGKLQAEAGNDDLRSTLAIVFSNSLKSLTAAFALLRGGWRLQPFQCVRNSYEALGVALHVFTQKEALALLKTDTLKSTTAVKSLNKLFPMLGRLWDDLSGQFVHVGKPFRHIQQGNVYTKDETLLWHCLGQIAFLTWFLYQGIELVFYDSAKDRRFWAEEKPGAYSLKPNPEMEELKIRMIQTYQAFMPVSDQDQQ